MNSVLLYVRYDEDSLESYITASVNGEKVANFIRIPDELNYLREALENSEIANNAEWCAVADAAAPDWDLVEFMRSNGYEARLMNIDGEQLCALISECFGGSYCIGEYGDLQGTEIKLLYHVETTNTHESSPEPKIQDELLEKAKVILASESSEKTSLARIIEEKYKRIGR